EDQSAYSKTLQTLENPNYSGSLYNNLILSPRLEIHLKVLGTIADDERSINEDQSHMMLKNLVAPMWMRS
ncbi:hypothetical protein J1N35_025125, partial [Gossypium stocksii]